MLYLYVCIYSKPMYFEQVERFTRDINGGIFICDSYKHLHKLISYIFLR